MKMERLKYNERNGLPLMKLSYSSDLPESFKVDCQKSQIEKRKQSGNNHNPVFPPQLEVETDNRTENKKVKITAKNKY